MKKNTAITKITLLPLLFLLLALPAAPALGAMTDYCVSPPFLAQSISPNILIVLDSSGSMCGQAYPGSYDPTQFTNSLYYGYFDGTKNYQYTGNRWEVTSAAMGTGTNANPIATGSFLNWATMRRIEVAKKLLVGGKGNPRSPSPGNTVKLDAQTDCGTTFDKDFLVTNQIFPFVGNYRFQNNDGTFNITPLDAGSISTLRPTSDITVTPAGWSEFPVAGAVVMYTKVAEASSDDDTTYIQNNNTTNPVIMGFNYAGATPAGSISVTLKVRAKKTNSGSTREINNVLRIDGVDWLSPAMALSTSYDTYSWTLANNPAGGAWTWDQIKKIAATGNLNGFGVKASQTYTSKFVRVTQVYLEVSIPQPAGGSYNIIVDQGGVKATGIIDDLDTQVRFGLAYYNASNGGIVNTYVGYNSPTNMITSIENMTPSGWTPLAETLYEMVRYFRQDDPYYSNNPNDYSPGSGAFGPNIYRDPYAYKFTDVDASLTDQYVPCAKSFILLLTDGESTEDQNIPGTATTAPYAPCTLDNLKACSGYGGPNPRFAGTPVGQTYSSSGTDYLIDVAYWARTNDMRPGTETDIPTTWRKSLPGTQNIFLYPVYMFGTGSSLLKDAAIYGGFVDLNGNNKPDCTTNPAECYRDSDNDGTVRSDGSDLPLTYYEGNDGYALEQNLKQAIYDMLKRAASSTAVSVLSSSEGSGATLVQSLFYPNRSFPNSADITWTSDLMNYWYYLDPFFASSQIREDTIRDDSAYTLLSLTSDYITTFYFDPAQQKTLAARYQDTDGNGTADINKGSIPIEDAKAIWRAGVNLWWTTPSSRTIKTSIDGANLMSFDTTNVATLDDYLGQTASTSAAKATISYVRGDDCVDTNGVGCDCVTGGAGCLTKICLTGRTPCSTDTDCGAGDTCVAPRNRIAKLKVCSASRMTCNTDADCTGSGGTCAEETHIWKLGDVISSTPRIMGPSPSNSFNLDSPFGYGDKTYKNFITSLDYKNRQRVFVGANDGMLHAFRLGKVLQTWPGKHWYEVGKLEGAAGIGGIGTENWAFIPENVLPYLQYLSKPDYCHIYMMDGPVVMTDASINKINAPLAPLTCGLGTDYWNCPKQTTVASGVLDLANTSWRSIVIGSMGIGGATSSGVDATCVKTPLTVAGTPVGWSSYFALDVTAQDNPTLLWEFSNSELGVTNVGPAIVRTGIRRCATSRAVCTQNSDCGVIATNGKCVDDENGRWFAILASGSTGPITARDFKGTSNKNLRLFVVDLKTGALMRTIDTGITNAFAGSISTGSLDLEKDKPNNSGNYKDDAVYIGYVKDTTSGGVLRLLINDDIDPANWTVTPVIENIGPVTTSVTNLIDRKNGKLWLYFAEGRYFHKQDDLTTQRKLFGIADPCFVATSNSISPTCTTERVLADLKDQTTSPTTALTNAQKGWYINLDAAVSPNGAERVISNPTPDPLGAVYFLSFAPTSDICSFGGTTYLWAVDYKTGSKVTFVMQGKALVQVSTGEIKELSLGDPTVLSQNDSRRSTGFQGIPPAGQGLMVVTNPTPIKKFMHIQER
ncbi:MAG: hypothetical protein NT087_03130 [Deltaproteobacteria bacterium]|nr:hypothetical protein [Deltaproteobacteria bacterium]